MNITQKINDIAIEYFDDNNVRFAQKMGTSETNIRNYRSKTVPKLDFVVRLCNELSISFEWLFNDSGLRDKVAPQTIPDKEFVLRTDTRQDLQRVPLYDLNAAASLVTLFEGHQNIIDYITIPNLPKSDGAIYVTGDSMYPLLKAGDIAIYKKIYDISEGIRFGEMHIVSALIDGDLSTVVKFVKKSDKGDDWICLVSQNAHHAPRDLHMDKIKAIALVKASVRINSMM